MADLKIGTCSWKYPSWDGLVYSAPRGIDYLAEYARTYDTVEIDQWFWSLFERGGLKLPSPDDVAAYRAAVSKKFRFSVKVPNSITLTHRYRKSKHTPLVANEHFLSAGLFGEFLELLEPLEGVLGPLMFQFEYLNRQKMRSQGAFQERFGAFLADLPTGTSYGVEIRNTNWLNEPFFEFLHRNGVFPVLLQGYYMPPIVELYRTWRERLMDFGTLVIRLHGPDRKDIEKQTGKQWDQIVAPKDEELGSIARMTGELLAGGVNVFVNVNNHYEGSAPRTIERLSQLLLDLP